MALQQSLLRIAVGVSLLGIAVGARAEPLLVTLEASGALPLTAPQNERFGPGGSAALGLLYPLAPALLIGLRARAGLLTEGDPPQDPGQVDYELGGLDTASVVVRLRPLAGGDGVRRATGLFIEGAAGVALAVWARDEPLEDGRPACVVVCGGNLDLADLEQVLRTEGRDAGR